ncbi:lysine N(6)-hydroxylase/L-ornithine N(5)-oxygenase family protein [Amycolatopsis sp. NPDC088138]|uniref:lysine N(6)-hydroxylase/L-ornithine N(5)-oxygenase family protein n=1 Tax=Amycolatopsis sp. NPDC088138 TaxID=3363938 RepID=UPI0038172AD2
MTTSPVRRYRLLGVGFGPSHLSLSAVCESTRDPAVGARVHFLEAKPEFAWHPDMLLDGARMQVAFLKDLVTPHDPTSSYTFANYLVHKGRLEQFLNLGTLHPTRREYADYFRWAAERLAHYVSYGCAARRVRPAAGRDGVVTHLEVEHLDRRGAPRTVLAEHLSLAPGGRPKIPSGVAPAALASGAVFHSSRFLDGIARFRRRDPAMPYRFLVVGAGQSAAEIFRHLAGEFPSARVTLAHHGFALQPANSSPLANEIFNPESVDLFHGAEPARRRAILGELRMTNYGAVDDEDIRSIAGLLYDQRVHGGDRLRLRRLTDLAGASTDDTGLVRVVLRDLLTGGTAHDRYDGVVLATGYDFREARDLLTGIEPHLVRDAGGALRIRRDYSVETTERFRPKVFLHGAAEHTHGLSSTLLSVQAHRAADILAATFGDPAGEPTPLPIHLEGADK